MSGLASMPTCPRAILPAHHYLHQGLPTCVSRCQVHQGESIEGIWVLCLK